MYFNRKPKQAESFVCEGVLGISLQVVDLIFSHRISAVIFQIWINSI